MTRALTSSIARSSIAVLAALGLIACSSMSKAGRLVTAAPSAVISTGRMSTARVADTARTTSHKLRLGKF